MEHDTGLAHAEVEGEPAVEEGLRCNFQAFRNGGAEVRGVRLQHEGYVVNVGGVREAGGGPQHRQHRRPP
eukprot:774284-Lingulodinium_polyedra.AAC.1